MRIRTAVGLLYGLPVLAIFASPTAANAPAPRTPSVTERKISLLRRLEKLEVEAGRYSPEAIPSLVELSGLYVDQGECPEALFMLNRAMQLTRINYGLFSASQMEMGELMKECDLTLRLPRDFEREQRYTVLMSEHLYGRDDPRILPALKRVALWYEQAGWYLSARKLYIRAADIARRAGGDMDLRLVDPLRGIARARRLAATQGLASDDIAINGGAAAVTDRFWRKSETTLDSLGRESLEQAVKILRARAEVNGAELVDTLLDLGDWYQTDKSWQHALASYREALRESNAAGGTENLFAEPVPVAFRMEDIGVELRHPLAEDDLYEPCRVTFAFTVRSDGEVRNLTVLEADAPEFYRQAMTKAFRQTRFRPRFAAGEPVDTLHVSFKQTWRVKTWSRLKKTSA